MSNPLKGALVPIAAAKIRSGGVDLIVGETVDAFYGWLPHIQKLHQARHAVILMPAAEAAKANAKAAEIRAATSEKQVVSAVKGKEAEIRGLVQLARALEDQLDEIRHNAERLSKELEDDGETLQRILDDEFRRPEDSESDAANAAPSSDVHEATGIKVEPNPESKDDTEPVDEDDGSEGDAPRVDASLVDDTTIGDIKQWAKEKSYRELQQEAKKLGLNGVGKKQKELLPLVIDAAIKAHAVRLAEEAEVEETTETSNEGSGSDE